MAKTIFTLLLALLSCCAFGQLNGSGKTVTRTFGNKNFDKLYFKDLDGKIEVTAGKTFSITLTIDDNLQELFELTQDNKENALTLKLKNNENNKLYVEATHISIKITMPELTVVSNSGNSNTIITGITGRYLRIENFGNGDVTASGTIASLDIAKDGNGDIDAQKLKSTGAEIKAAGNGNVLVNVTRYLNAKTSGNGDITNYGSAIFDDLSTSKGNGKLNKIKS